VCIDNLLLRLSNSGVGCYMGTNFVGALAYADDTALLSSTPAAAARKLLSICETFAVLVCLLVCLSVAKMQKKLWSVLTTYRKSNMGFSKNLLLDP